MNHVNFEVVTGAYGYSGKYIARKLLSKGRTVVTLTDHPESANEFGDRIKAMPFNFDGPGSLIKSLQGADTLYNTYWVRFSHGKHSFDQAVNNTKILIAAAKEAGVRRIVHLSIANPSENSPLSYYSGKADLESAIIGSGLSYAILRPTVIFGDEDILINNIAWFLRKFPFFAVPGKGDYKIQPVFVEDLAELAVNAGESGENKIVDAVGPEIYSFEELVRLIASSVKSRAGIAHIPAPIVHVLLKVVGTALGDVVLTYEEIKGLTANLLVSGQRPPCKTKFSDWLKDHAHFLGIKYRSEIQRHFH